jgi:hypothetical protein
MADERNKPGLTPDEVKSRAPAQKAARGAYSALIGRVSVLVFPEGPRGSSGTGLLLATGQGTPFLLTARHLLEGGELLSTLAVAGPSVGPTPLRGICERIFLGPLRPGQHDHEHEYVDVAAASLSRHGRERLAAPAGVAIAETSATMKTDVVVIAGFPSFLSRAAVHSERKLIDMHVASIMYVTGIEGIDEFRRLQVEWHQARAVWDIPDMPHFKVEHGTTFELGAPFGVSGGGVWRVRGPDHPTEGLWTPTTHCQLIGVASAKLERVEFAEPVELWRDWLRDVEREIDVEASSR